ncbi:ComF family protein [Clostridium perfringens]|uniref:ComF family protein n=1 Tax=Clostridium perfringens TaxID=1502 RepID=UPI000F8C8777|nr:ComF family protein [Clostridium perfringens]RUR40474.1 ComF family protein [Clostridium perfringens]
MEEENGIYYFSDYEPYSINGARNTRFNKVTGGYLLDLKDNKDIGVNYFTNLVINELREVENLDEFDIITIIPSSEAHMFRIGMMRLAQSIDDEFENIEFVYCLERVETVEKKANGGIRSAELEQRTIHATEIEKFQDKKVLLFDDVTTTGTSLKSCEKILIDNGAKEVVCLALAKTVNHHLISNI